MVLKQFDNERDVNDSKELIPRDLYEFRSHFHRDSSAGKWITISELDGLFIVLDEEAYEASYSTYWRSFDDALEHVNEQTKDWEHIYFHDSKLVHPIRKEEIGYEETC